MEVDLGKVFKEAAAFNYGVPRDTNKERRFAAVLAALPGLYHWMAADDAIVERAFAVADKILERLEEPRRGEEKV